jgi:hypothetical protein
MRTVLLGPARENALVLNAQAHPPDVELREPVDARRGERDAVVRANRPWQPVGTEQSVEDGAHAVPYGRAQAVTGDQESGVLIGDGQRITVDGVLGSEVALEVGRPEIIRVRRRERHDARMGRRTAPPPLRHETVSCQQIAGRADGRQLEAGVPRCQPLEELLGPQLGC